MHMIRKGQARRVSSDHVRQQNQFIEQLFDQAAGSLTAQLLAGRLPSTGKRTRDGFDIHESSALFHLLFFGSERAVPVAA